MGRCLRAERIEAVVVHFGVGIANSLESPPGWRTMMHFGDLDMEIPNSDLYRIASTFPDITIRRHQSNHGFT